MKELVNHTSLWSEIKKCRNIYLFVLPAVLYFAIFRYMPLFYVQIAFKDYRITRDIAACDWVGFKHFEKLFSGLTFIRALKNTIIISFYKLLFGFPMPIILALLLNEMKNLKFKRLTQTLIYLPHFISWSILGGVMYNLLSVEGGAVNSIIGFFGGDPVFFMGDKNVFRGVLVVSDIWKSMGWGTILYLAALTRIDPSLYEAAIVDGANRFQKLVHITLPGIISTIMILLIIRIGHLLDVGFEQILVLSNDMVQPVADVLDTYVYRIGLVNGKHSLATAAGLFKTVVAALMVYSADRFVKFMGEEGIF
jgi:putative aldouronate transport system permease protein